MAPEYEKSVPLENKASSPPPSPLPTIARRRDHAAVAAGPRAESPLFCTSGPGPGPEARDVVTTIESIEPREVGEANNSNSTIRNPNITRKRRSDNTDRDETSSSPRDSSIERRSRRRRLSGWVSAPIGFAPTVQDPNVTRERNLDTIDRDETPSSPRNGSMEPRAKRRIVRKISALIENAPTSEAQEDGSSPAVSETLHPRQVGDEVDAVSSDEDTHDTGRSPTPEASKAQGRGRTETPQPALKEDRPDLIDFTLPSPRGGWRQHGYDHDTGPADLADEVQETIGKGHSLQYERIPRSSPPHLTPPIKLESEEGDLQYDIVDDVDRYRHVDYYDDDEDDEREDERPGRSPSVDTTAANEERERQDAAIATALQEWIDAKVSRHFDERLVLLALRRTTLDGDLAEIVLEHNREYNTDINININNNNNNDTTPTILLPTGIPGIWTEEDDEDVTSGDPDRMRAMIAKHDLEICNERYIFLQNYRSPASSKRTSISSAGGNRS